MKSIRQRLLVWLLPGLLILWGAAGTALYFSVKKGLETKFDSELRELVNPVRFLLWARYSGDERPQVPGNFRGLDVHAFERPDSGTYFQSWDKRKRIEKSESLGQIDLDRWPSLTEQAKFQNLTLPNGDIVRAIGMEVRPPPGFRRGGGRFGPGPGPPRGDRDGDRREWFGREFGGPRGPERTVGGPDREERGRPDRGRERPEWDRGMEPRGADGRPRGGYGRPDEIDVVVARSRTEIDQTLTMLLGGITFSGLIAILASVVLVRIALGQGLAPLEKVGEQARRIDASSLQTRFPSDMPDELRPIAEALNGLLARIEDSFERERRFSSDIAHELRTPVAELKSMAEVAIKWPEQADAENYEEVRDISDQMQALIENLLMLARLEKGKAQVQLSEVKIGDLVKSCWQPFAEKAKARSLVIEFDLNSDQTWKTDDKLLRVIVSNLLSNAAEYAPEKSRLICTGRDQQLTLANPAGDLTKDDLSPMFERLWRQDKSRTDSSHSGLGLALARSCADAMEMKLDAEITRENQLQFSLTRT